MKRLLLLLCSSLFLCAGSIYADSLKVGVVNLESVIISSPLAISYNEKLSKDFKPRQDALNSTQKKLQDELDQLNYNSYRLTTDERVKLQNIIAEDRRNFEAQNASLQKDLSAAQAQYTQSLMNKLNAVIAKIAQDGRYDIIQTNANLIYLNPSVDLTQEVIKQLK